MTISKPILFHHMGDATYVNRRLELLLKVGCKLMESAADTPRIMRNMKRTAAFLNLKDECLQVYVNYNLLMVNYSDDEHSYTKFQRCTKHGIDMTAISRISRLSWTAIKDDYTLDEFEKAFDDLFHTSQLHSMAGCHWRWFCLRWILHTVRVRLACILLCFDSCNIRV